MQDRSRQALQVNAVREREREREREKWTIIIITDKYMDLAAEVV